MALRAGQGKGGHLLLRWYDQNRRRLPWRVEGGETPDPYRVWLSEVMLQQTTVPAVIPYFLKFTEKWADIRALAASDQEEVMREWAGLGYYARARNLHKCARIVTAEHGGLFPDTEEGLKTLPGIGAYTAAAVAAIAFNRPCVVIDANVERVICRLFAIKEPIKSAKKEIKAAAELFYNPYPEKAGDMAQALMDLGSLVCMPKSPRCGLCPIRGECAAYNEGVQDSLPALPKKKEKPTRYGNFYWIRNKKGEVLAVRREDKAMMGGMIGLPTSNWEREEGAVKHPESLRRVRSAGEGAQVRHSFTHFTLILNGFYAELQAKPDGALWLDPLKMEAAGFPTLFRKAVLLMTKGE